MFILSNFIKAVAIVLEYSLQLYMYIVIARALISWVNPDPYNPIVQFLHRATDPVMNRVRKMLGMGGMGGIDFSPILIIFAIVFLQVAVVGSLKTLAIQLQMN